MSMRLPKSILKRASLIAGVLAMLLVLAWGAVHGAIYVRHALQIRFAEMHAFLSDEDEEGSSADGQLSDAEILARENMTVPVQPGTGELPWALLSQTKIVFSDKGILAPEYPEILGRLNRQQIQIRGFMFPLDPAAKQVHFLLSPYPPGCSYCLPAGANELIEVFSEEPVRFSHDALSMRGEFELLKAEDDLKAGMLYRMKRAVYVAGH